MASGHKAHLIHADKNNGQDSMHNYLLKIQFIYYCVIGVASMAHLRSWQTKPYSGDLAHFTRKFTRKHGPNPDGQKFGPLLGTFPVAKKIRQEEVSCLFAIFLFWP